MACPRNASNAEPAGVVVRAGNLAVKQVGFERQFYVLREEQRINGQIEVLRHQLFAGRSFFAAQQYRADQIEVSLHSFFAHRQSSATRGGQTMSITKKAKSARCAVAAGSESAPLRRVEANLRKQAEWYRTRVSDPHGINTALYVANLKNWCLQC